MDPDQAWKTLSLVVDWIKHAEAKTGATLTGAAAAGVALYTLLRSQSVTSTHLRVFAVVAAIGILGCALCAVIGLLPQLRVKRQSKTPSTAALNPLFFGDVVRGYPHEAGYSQALGALTEDPGVLVKYLSQQVWANAHVAQRKYRWLHRALCALALGLAGLAGVSIALGIQSLSIR